MKTTYRVRETDTNQFLRTHDAWTPNAVLDFPPYIPAAEFDTPREAYDAVRDASAILHPPILLLYHFEVVRVTHPDPEPRLIDLDPDRPPFVVETKDSAFGTSTLGRAPDPAPNVGPGRTCFPNFETEECETVDEAVALIVEDARQRPAGGVEYRIRSYVEEPAGPPIIEPLS